ncbi:hypothetical protein SP15_207 [Bacillus phage SP-15]|uniref:Uncharacterized protein n=1 Tax=Bacillus phage SP-15 TaxID=1792032 RepID=A0A127AWP4_9CAUD|nr:hypothetical protein SP15_207 [Bacillus phage SP-15]AMM45007.1 hypothetical protein SP15_207 [Bacillus phage SP-15]
MTLIEMQKELIDEELSELDIQESNLMIYINESPKSTEESLERVRNRREVLFRQLSEIEKVENQRHGV